MGLVAGKLVSGLVSFSKGVDFVAVLGTGLPLFLACCWARYCLRLTSKSGSFK